MFREISAEYTTICETSCHYALQVRLTPLRESVIDFIVLSVFSFPVEVMYRDMREKSRLKEVSILAFETNWNKAASVEIRARRTENFRCYIKDFSEYWFFYRKFVSHRKNDLELPFSSISGSNLQHSHTAQTSSLPNCVPRQQASVEATFKHQNSESFISFQMLLCAHLRIVDGGDKDFRR